MLDTSERQTRLARNLCEIHGKGHFSTGKSGPVLNLACPLCLSYSGRKELESRHLAVLMAEALSVGSRVNIAFCMKQPNHRFTLNDLLDFPPITTRIPDYVKTEFKDTLTEKKHPLLRHESGIEVPYPPGECVPLTELPTDHVAVRYVMSRGYSPKSLVRQFNASFCVKELPPTPENGVWYRRWENGFNDTPQGRIVFFTTTSGIPVGWQSRLLDVWLGDTYYVFHPYASTWVEVGKRVSGALVYNPEYNTPRRKLSKYRNALGMLSGNLLFGHDVYAERNKDVPHRSRVLVLVEGPLDAARFPSNAVAYTRATISPAQARMAADLANTVVLASDNDEVALGHLERNMELLAGHVGKLLTISPAPFKDFGEAGRNKSTEILNKALNEH